MIEVTEITNSGRRVVHATAETFAEAKAKVETLGRVCLMEDDADYEDCADAYLLDGRVIAVQPVGFTLAAAKKSAKAKAHAKTMHDAAAAFDAEYGIGQTGKEVPHG